MRAMTAVWEDERVVVGMRAQLELRDRLLAEGAEPLGWKLGFSTQAAMQTLGTSGALVGFLVDRAMLAPGAVWEIEGVAVPAVEPEVALHLGSDLEPGGDPAAAIAGISPAFELIDLHGPLDDPERILAVDVFQRHVVIAGSEPALPGPASRPATIRRPGQPDVRVEDPQTTVGDFAASLEHLAAYLAAFGQRLRAGEIVITGSMIPLVKVVPGDALELELDGAPPIAVSVT
jgi:2-oxo-3-hexenedioate decarboxylase